MLEDDRCLNYPCVGHVKYVKVTNTVSVIITSMLFRDMKLYFPVIYTLVVFFSTYVYALRAAPKHASNSTSESELDIRFGEDFDGSAVKRLGSPYLQLPIFQHSRIPLLEKEQFAPMRGSGFEQLPEMTKEVLIPRATVRASSRRQGRSQAVKVVCQMKKMIVKVNKQILGLDGLQSELKLGTCDISKTTKHYHVFIYDMDQCASKRQVCLVFFFFVVSFLCLHFLSP